MERPSLGDQELELLRFVTEHAPISVGEAARQFGEPRQLARNTVLTVMELTKQTQIFATNLGSWVVPGALCAALYLAMSLPLSALARRLERRWKAATE